MAERQHGTSLSESQWMKSQFSIRKWESEEHKSVCLPARGFRDHVAAGVSLLGVCRNMECMWLVSGAIGS